MTNVPKSSIPTLPPESPQGIPIAAERAAKRVGWGSWLTFWGQLLVGAVTLVLLGLAVISRWIDDGDRTIWVGLSIVLAIASLVTLLISVYLAFRLTRLARYLMVPQLTPTPSPSNINNQATLALLVSTVGLALGLLGAELSTVSLLAKTFSNPQGAALPTAESTLRVLDVLVILVNSGLALVHFGAQVVNFWILRQEKS